MIQMYIWICIKQTYQYDTNKYSKILEYSPHPVLYSPPQYRFVASLVYCTSVLLWFAGLLWNKVKGSCSLMIHWTTVFEIKYSRGRPKCPLSVSFLAIFPFMNHNQTSYCIDVQLNLKYYNNVQLNCCWNTMIN